MTITKLETNLNIPVISQSVTSWSSRIKESTIPIFATLSSIALLSGNCKAIAATSCIGASLALYHYVVQVPSVYRRAFDDKSRDFIRRIRGADRDIAIAKLESLRNLTTDEIQAFKKYRWMHPVFNIPDWPYLVLKAHIDGDLDAKQAAKLFLFEQVKKTGSKNAILQSLNQDRELSPNMRKLLMENFHINSLAVTLIEEKLQNLPLEETEFFVVDVAPYLSAEEYHNQSRNGDVDIYNFLLHVFQFSFLMNIRDGRIWQLVLPPRLYDAILQGRFHDPMKSNPILGYLKKDRLSDTTKRIQSIPSSFTQLPTKIHGFIDAREPLAMLHHDQTHLYIESANPERLLWTKLALHFQKSDPELFTILIDRVYFLYSMPWMHSPITGRTNLNKMEIFWYSLSSLSFSEPGVWNGEKGNKRLKEIIRFLQEEGVKLESLVVCYQKENPKCSFSLKDWAKAASLILDKSDLRNS